jgi:thiol-disulfide isomerase/thioredoxin
MRAILSQAITLGPVSVPSWLLLYFVALLVAWTVSRYLRVSEVGSRASDVVLNSATLWLLGWKLTPAVLRPGVLLRDPLAVLAAPGGTIGTVVGLALGVGYAVISITRSKRAARVGLSFAAGLVAGGFAFFIGVAVLGVVLSAEAPGADRTAPEFALPRLRPSDEGDTVSLSDYRGKTVLLNFWATWCPPCRAEIPDLVEFHDRTAGSDVVLVSVNQTFSEGGIDRVSSFVRETGIEYAVLLDRTGEVSRAYGVRGIPTTFVIGEDGRVKERVYGAVSRSRLSRW